MHIHVKVKREVSVGAHTVCETTGGLYYTIIGGISSKLFSSLDDLIAAYPECCAARPLACRVCGSDNRTFLCQTHNEHSRTSTLSNYRCRDCGSVFVGDNLQREELETAYKTLDMEAYYAEIERENRRKMESAVSFVSQTTRKNAKILDLGTGNGLLVRLLKDAGYQDVSAHEIAGADLSELQGVATAIYQDFDYSTIPSDTFDLVTMLDVVEHVPDPRALMQQVHRILKPVGVVYFHTPVVTRTDRLMHAIQRLPLVGKLGRIWQRGRTSIFHLQNYTPHSINHLLSDHELSFVNIRTKNELSWPLARYVRIYLLEKQGLPQGLAPLLAPLLYPLLATRLMNANKAIVSAIKSLPTYQPTFQPNP